MPYQPTNPYPYNTGLDIENGLTLYFKVDNYDIINSFKVEIHDVYKEELLYSIIRSVGEIADNKVIEGDKQIIEIYDKQNEQVYIDYYGKKSSLPVIGGQGVQSICELELTDYLMKIEDIEKTKYYNNTENAVNLQIAPAEMFTYDETGTEITGINTDYEGYENYMADLVIPYKNTTKVGNPLIVSIGEEAISKSGYRMITHLTIPNSVIEIKNKAFSSCQISTLNLNYGTNIIGEQAFESTGIQELFLVDSIEQIGISAFAGCSTLQKVTFSSRLKKIPDSCFYNTRIKDIIIPDTVEIIGDNAFNVIDSGGADTAILQLGKNVKSIGMSAFLQQKFTEVIIPESVEEIKESAFFANASLKKFICKGKNISFGKNVLGNCNIEELTIPYIKEHNLLGYLFSGAVTTQTISNEAVPSTLTSVTLTNADKIPDEMFSKCSEILNYSLNEGIISIGTKAFYNDCKMQSIIIPSTVTEIGKQAFAVDEGIILDSTIEFNFIDSKQSLVIKEKAFSNNIAIKAIQIPNRTVTIGLGAFEGCSNLTTIVLPFVGKEKMQVTNGEPTLTGKEGYYFDYIFGSQRATQDTKCKNIPSSLTTVVITDNCKIIPPYAFYNGTTEDIGECSNIKNINISSYVTTIYKYAFYLCKGISNFTIPVKCTYIGEFALQYKLNGSISYTWYSDIPYNIDNVESPVFTLQLIDNWVNLNTASFLGNMFLDITTSPYKQYVLQTGNVPKNDTGRVEKSNIDTEIVAYYTELYKYLINKEKETIIKQNGGICGDNITYTLMQNEITGKNIITLKGQGKMFDYDNQSNISPFAKIQDIEEINMEDSLITYIGNYSFSNLLESTEYTTVKFPLTLQQIGDYGFYNRRLLPTTNNNTEYYLDFSGLSNLTTIGWNAFDKSIYFESAQTENIVVFPNNLTFMKGNCINNSYNMNHLKIPIVYNTENYLNIVLYITGTRNTTSELDYKWFSPATTMNNEQYYFFSCIGITHMGLRKLHFIESNKIKQMNAGYLNNIFTKDIVENANKFSTLIIDAKVGYCLYGINKLALLECYCGGDIVFPRNYMYYNYSYKAYSPPKNNSSLAQVSSSFIKKIIIKGVKEENDMSIGWVLPSLSRDSIIEEVVFDKGFQMQNLKQLNVENTTHYNNADYNKNKVCRRAIVNEAISDNKTYNTTVGAFCPRHVTINNLDFTNIELSQDENLTIPAFLNGDSFLQKIIVKNNNVEYGIFALAEITLDCDSMVNYHNKSIQIEVLETASGQSAVKTNEITNNKISVLSEEEDITPIEEVRAMANEAATTTDKKILKIENDRKYDWKLYLYGKKFDVYVTDNNTYADKSSYIPKVYLPKNSQMKEGQEIIFEGEDKYLISDIQNFNYTNKIFYRQSRGVLEGQLSYYSLLTGILTYDETNPANPWIIDADLKPYLLSTPVNFSTGSTYDKDLDKGTISIDGEDIINVNLNDKTSTEEYTKGVRITLQKTILTQAYLPTDLIDMATIGTSFTIGTDNSLQTITKIDDYYTVTVSPGFEVITNGYTSSRIVIANKNLILPQDLNTNQVVIVVDVSGKLSLEGDLYEVVKQGTIDKKLCSLIKVGVTTFELPNITSVGTTTYIITKVDSTTGKINFEDSSGNGYSIKRSDNQNYDIVLFNYLDISDEDFDTTDLHVTLNYINIYDVNKISLYASGDTEEGKLLNLKEHEILYLIECSSVVNATDYQVNERSMEKEAVLERYCSIVTVTNLDGSIPNSVRIPGDTWYFIYSNYIETPGYYFETVTEQPVKITINDEVIEKSEEGTYSYTLTSGIGNFLAEYKGNVSSYSWTLFEDYGGEYIEIANKQDTYSAYLFYDYFLFEDNKQYKMVLQIITNEGLIVSYTIIINTAFNNEITLSNIYVEKECDKEKAIKIDLDKKVINIDSSSSIREARVKSYYIIRRLANNHGVEDTVLAYVEDVAEFYDYSFKREDTYEYYVLPIYLVGDKEYRGVPALCQTIDKTNKIRYDLRLIVLKNTVMDYEELFKTSKIENSFEAETGEYDTWILKYNSEANNADIITDKATYDSISQFATVNKTKRNYKTGNITALLGKMHTDNEQFTYKDSILLQNKLQAFANNGKIKMLRDEIGNVMPVDITLKSFEYNPKAIPSTIAVSFEWTQLADEKTFSVYKTIGVKEG